MKKIVYSPVKPGKGSLYLAVLATVLLTAMVQLLLLNPLRPVSAVATTPTTMNFQGRLTNSAGSIMADGLYNMKFRIYDASTAGTLKWSELRETTNRVQVTNGLFSVQLGQVTPLDPTIFASGSLYFEIELPTPATATCSTAACGTFTEGPMTPRNKLSTSAYAYNAETLDGIDSASFARNDQANTFLGAQTVKVTSATALQIQNAGLTETIFTADTSSNQIKIGNSTAATGADVSLLVLDNAAATTTPSGIAGAMYYDSTNNKFKCYTSAWGDCSSAGGGVSTIGAFSTTSIANGASISGSTLTLGVADGTNPGLLSTTTQTIAGAKTFTGTATMNDLVISAGKSISLNGGITSTRPASPTEGTLYYDTTTKQLLTFANGKWQADRNTATKIVAASNSSQALKDAADYVATGTGDQTTINTALTAASGGKVFLFEGTYTISAPISVPSSTTLAGAGNGSVITAASGSASSFSMINNSNAGLVAGNEGIVISDLKLNGNTSNITTNIYGISFEADFSGTTNLKNLIIERVSFNDVDFPIYTEGNGTIIRGNYFEGAPFIAIDLETGSKNTVSNNVINTTATTNAAVVAYKSTKNTISNNIIDGGGGGIDLNNLAQYNSVVGNTISNTTSAAIDAIDSSSNVISGNVITNSGGSTKNDAIYLSNASSNSIVGNVITDSSASTNNYSINIFNSTASSNYISNNQVGTGSINDAGTGTRYADQINGSGQLVSSASGGIVSKLISGSTNDLFQAQNASGTALMKVTSAGAIQSANFDTLAAGALTLGSTNATSIVLSQNSSIASGKTFQTQGDTSVRVTSASAFQVQNAGGTALLAVDTSGGTVTIGAAVNGVVLSANGVTYSGTARSTNTITLTPEYAGAVFMGDGTNNTGTLTSDFCSGSAAGGMNINATACGGATTNTRNYYQWANTQATSQDYDIYVRYQMPSNYSAGSMTNLKILGWGDTTSESIVIAMYVDGTTAACSTSTNAATANATWSSSTIASPLGSCTVNAGDMVTFKVSLVAGQNKSARASAISFGYRGAF